MTPRAIFEQAAGEAPERRRVGVAPAAAANALEQLLSALGAMHDVAFEPYRGRPDGLAGLVSLDDATEGLPAALPVLMFGPSAEPRRGSRVKLSAHELVPAPLRGAELDEHSPGAPGAGLTDGSAGRSAGEDGARPGGDGLADHAPLPIVLATTSGGPAWSASTDGLDWRCACAPSELGPEETLRSRLRPGRFLAVLALETFLRRIAGTAGWQRPPLRASFVIDDPNLHWRSYGFLDYRALVAQAQHLGHHVGFATVPLDGRLVDRRAAELVRGHGARLSLVVHGNDHVTRELGRLLADEQAELAVAQALRRTDALERRAGVHVGRVMVPPHGACSEPALRAMLRLGFDAACVSRPYPWRRSEQPESPLEGWQPAELVAGGLPVLPRYHLDHPREELAFRALLGQPLILYGHHWDFASGLEPFEQAVADVTAVGAASWESLEQIALNSYSTRRRGAQLDVLLHSRRVRLSVPEGVELLSVRTAAVHDRGRTQEIEYRQADGSRSAVMEPAADGWQAPPVTVAGPREIEVRLPAARALDPRAVPAPPVRPWPSARRALVEGRDRVRPLLSGRVHLA